MLLAISHLRTRSCFWPTCDAPSCRSCSLATRKRSRRTRTRCCASSPLSPTQQSRARAQVVCRSRRTDRSAFLHTRDVTSLYTSTARWSRGALQSVCVNNVSVVRLTDGNTVLLPHGGKPTAYQRGSRTTPADRRQHAAAGYCSAAEPIDTHS